MVCVVYRPCWPSTPRICRHVGGEIGGELGRSHCLRSPSTVGLHVSDLTIRTLSVRSQIFFEYLLSIRYRHGGSALSPSGSSVVMWFFRGRILEQGKR